MPVATREQIHAERDRKLAEIRANRERADRQDGVAAAVAAVVLAVGLLALMCL